MADDELTLIALAALVELIEDGHGRALVEHVQLGGALLLHGNDGEVVAVLTVTATPITRDGDGH